MAAMSDESIVAPVESEKDLESTASGESSSNEVSPQSSGRVSRLRLDAFLVLNCLRGEGSGLSIFSTV